MLLSLATVSSGGATLPRVVHWRFSPEVSRLFTSSGSSMASIAYWAPIDSRTSLMVDSPSAATSSIPMHRRHFNQQNAIYYQTTVWAVCSRGLAVSPQPMYPSGHRSQHHSQSSFSPLEIIACSADQLLAKSGLVCLRCFALRTCLMCTANTRTSMTCIEIWCVEMLL